MKISDIIQSFIDGDLEAFDNIYDMFSKQIFSYCYRYTLSRETAEEITNDVFLHLWRKRSCIDFNLGIKGLIYRVTRNKLSKWLKDNASNRKVLTYMEVGYLNEKTDHDQQIEAIIDLSALKKAVDCLPPQRKRIFELCKFGEMTYTEVAERLSISKDSVRKHMIEANKTLGKITKSGEFQYYYCLLFPYTLIQIFSF